MRRPTKITAAESEAYLCNDLFYSHIFHSATRRGNDFSGTPIEKRTEGNKKKDLEVASIRRYERLIDASVVRNPQGSPNYAPQAVKDMSTEGTRYIVDESDLLHLLAWHDHAQDLHLPACGLCGFRARCAQDLRLPLHDASNPDLSLRYPRTTMQDRSLRLDFADRVQRFHRVMSDETRPHERWLRLHPRASRKVN